RATETCVPAGPRRIALNVAARRQGCCRCYTLAVRTGVSMPPPARCWREVHNTFHLQILRRLEKRRRGYYLAHQKQQETPIATDCEELLPDLTPQIGKINAIYPLVI